MISKLLKETNYVPYIEHGISMFNILYLTSEDVKTMNLKLGHAAALKHIIKCETKQQYIDKWVTSTVSSHSSQWSSGFCTPDLFPGGLEHFLKGSIRGRIILSDRHNLSHKLRRYLTDIIMNHFVLDNPLYEVSHAMFAAAASEICAVFPNEVPETYYVVKPKSFGGRLFLLHRQWRREMGFPDVN